MKKFSNDQLSVIVSKSGPTVEYPEDYYSLEFSTVGDEDYVMFEFELSQTEIRPFLELVQEFYEWVEDGC